MGRNQASWKGEYLNVDLEKSVEAKDVRYYLIMEKLELDSVPKEVHSFVPESWLCTGTVVYKSFILVCPSH